MWSGVTAVTALAAHSLVTAARSTAPGVAAAVLQGGTPTPSPASSPALPGAGTPLGRALAWLSTDPGRVVLALAVLVVGYYTSKVVVKYLGRPTARRFRRPSVARTVLRAVRMSILAVTVFVALAVLGVPIGDIVLPVTVFSAVVAIVLAPIVGSVINGLFVMADQPYEVGDMVEIADLGEGTQGFVDDITLRYTKIFTLDNTFLVVPNSSMRDRDVVNYSAEDERTRLSLQLLVTYESDVEAAREILERAARDVDEVISGGPDIRIGSARYPAGPRCYVDDYADSGVLLTMRYWTKRPYRLLAVRSRVNERIWAAIEDSDVVVAYPHQHLVFDDTSGQLRVGVGGDQVGPGEGGADVARGQQGRAGVHAEPWNPDREDDDDGGDAAGDDGADRRDADRNDDG